MITDYFDKALYINLDSRPDRRELAEKEFSKHSLNVERVEAVIGIKDFYSPLPKGHIGCIASHMKCLSMAKENKWDTVLIFEDDVVLKDNCNELFEDYFTRVPDNWDLLYLGGNHWGNCLQYRDGSKQITVASNVQRTYCTLTTHAYAIKKTIYDYMISTFETMRKEVDMLYVDAQQRFNAYCLRPNLAWQREDYSDINDMKCDYKFMQE